MPGVRYNRECVLLPAFLVLYRKFETALQLFACTSLSLGRRRDSFVFRNNFPLRSALSMRINRRFAARMPTSAQKCPAFLMLARPAKRLCLVVYNLLNCARHITCVPRGRRDNRHTTDAHEPYSPSQRAHHFECMWKKRARACIINALGGNRITSLGSRSEPLSSCFDAAWIQIYIIYFMQLLLRER